MPELVYVGDPLCSWCWGFAPTLAKLERRHDLPLRTVVGGLRTGDRAERLTDRMRAFLTHHWEQVEAASGQPFDHDVLAGFDQDWRYDTGPACRAVVAVREVAPDHALDYFRHLQRSFYVEGRDVTDLDVLARLTHRFADEREGLHGGRAVEVLRDPVSAERAREDFATARSWGVYGFPTLLLRDGDTMMQVAPGFVPYERLEPALTRWLDDRSTTGSGAAER